MIGLVNDSCTVCNVSDEVSSIYKLAAVEHAILGTWNWLNLLDLNDLEILEFSSDLKVCSITSYLNFVSLIFIYLFKIEIVHESTEKL